MTRIPVPTTDEIPTASRELLEWIMQTPLTGKVLNMQAQLAVAPATLAGYVGLRRTTEEHGTLDPKTRTAVLAMGGAALGVPYVERLTARIASSAGWQPDEIVRFTRRSRFGGREARFLAGRGGRCRQEPRCRRRRRLGTSGGRRVDARAARGVIRVLLDRRVHRLFHELRGHRVGRTVRPPDRGLKESRVDLVQSRFVTDDVAQLATFYGRLIGTDVVCERLLRRGAYGGLERRLLQVSVHRIGITCVGHARAGTFLGRVDPRFPNRGRRPGVCPDRPNRGRMGSAPDHPTMG